MKIDFSEYRISYCDYCSERAKEEDYRRCGCCISANDYLSVPTGFRTDNELVRKYAMLLSDYSKMLHAMGLDITK